MKSFKNIKTTLTLTDLNYKIIQEILNEVITHSDILEQVIGDNYTDAQVNAALAKFERAGVRLSQAKRRYLREHGLNGIY